MEEELLEEELLEADPPEEVTGSVSTRFAKESVMSLAALSISTV